MLGLDPDIHSMTAQRDEALVEWIAGSRGNDEGIGRRRE
jgi:hypothetical protein